MMIFTKLHFRKIRWLIGLLSFIPLVFFSPSSVFASTLSLSPGSGNIYIGSTKTVSVVLNTGGEAVNAVSAYLSYPADKMDVAWVSPGGAFSIQAENSYGGGVVKISRGNFSGVSGRITVATIGFRGKAAGSATVSFIGGSAVPRASDSSDSLNLGGSAGGVYVVGGSAPAGESKPIKEAGIAENVVLALSDLKITSVSTNSAVISWKTNLEADSLIDFGLDADKYFLNTSSNQLTKDHVIKLENPFFAPGLLLHFKVTSRIESGSVSSKDTILQLPGYSVKVKITDKSRKPVIGATAILYSFPIEGVTNQQGEVNFQNVTPGKHALLIRKQGIDKSTEVEVNGSSLVSVPQVFAVQIDVSQDSARSFFIYIGAIAGIIVLVMLIFFGRRFLINGRNSSKKLNQNPVSLNPPDNDNNEKNIP